MKKTYAEKLKDPRWQKKRLEMMGRDGFQCQDCGSAVRTLHVHHAYYEKGLEPWAYPDAAYVTLCARCHGVAERRRQKLLELTASPARQRAVLKYASELVVEDEKPARREEAQPFWWG